MDNKKLENARQEGVLGKVTITGMKYHDQEHLEEEQNGTEK